MSNKNKINKGRKLSEANKKNRAGKQYYKCANEPGSNLKGLENYQCPLWEKADIRIKGNFDESGYEIDHINEHCLTKDDNQDNLQALCKMCHSVKTKRFMMKKNTKQINEDKADDSDENEDNSDENVYYSNNNEIDDNDNLIISIIESTFVNKNTPQFHSIYYPDIKKSTGEIFQNDRWNTRKIDVIVNLMIEYCIHCLETYLDDFRGFMDKKTINKVKQTCFKYRNIDLRKKLISSIKILLFDNRKMIKYTKENSKYIDEN